MLKCVQNVVISSMKHNVATDDMFHDFENDANQANRSVIGARVFLSFLEYRYYIGPAPVHWYFPVGQRFLEQNR